MAIRRPTDARAPFGRSVAAVMAVIAPLLTSACRAPERATEPRVASHDRELSATQAAYLAQLAEAADAHPNDFVKQKASGLAHMRFTLSGVLSLQGRAERDLEAAFRLDRGDPELNRSLGRFYNLRAVVGDDAKAEQQVEVYAALLGDQPVDALDTRAFTAWSFFQLGRVLTQKKRGNLVAALGTVKSLEAELERRVQSAPDDIELYALAGNFAFFFAGNIPLNRRERVERAVRYFEVLRAEWEKLRPGAKDPEDCPNTYENFMFELAEGHTVLGEAERARAIYRELSVVTGVPTRAKEQIAFVAAERLRDLDGYLGNMDLMPPWPSDVGNCVVCHSYTADVPLTTLVTLRPLSNASIPSRAVAKPVAPTLEVPSPVRALLDEHCVRCHRRDGVAAAEGDFISDEGVLRRVRRIHRRVEAGEMPPDRALPPEARALLLEWAASDDDAR